MNGDAFAALRRRLVDELRARGALADDRVAAAFARVPRHVFLPDVPVADAYADRSIAIKLIDGIPISSASQPAIMAEMLEMLAPRTGDNMLEIGAGSGYNAALLAELVGPSGTVTTIDLDQDLVSGARRHLDEAGYTQVHTVCADGVLGAPESAPFDAVIASVGVERIPAAWIAQLRIGGRLVAPLTIRLLQKVIAFERTARGLESRAIVDAAFMMLRGPSASTESHAFALGDPGTTLRVLAAHAPALDPDTLARGIRTTPREVPAPRRVRIAEVWDGLSLWLAVHDDRFCQLSTNGPDRAHVPNLIPADAAYGFTSTFGLCNDGNLIVFAPRNPTEITLHAYNPDQYLIAAMQSAITAWDAANRPGNGELRVHIDEDGTTRIAP